MKNVISVVLVILASSITFAYGRNQQACSCNELERRLSGLEYVLNYAHINNYESGQISSDINYGYRQLSYSRNQSVEQQESTCSIGNQGVDGSWTQWQPWVAKQGMDRVYGCR